MSKITSHVLDTSLGVPAGGIAVELEFNRAGELQPEWESIGQGITDSDGRVKDLAVDHSHSGHFRISFFVADYFQKRNCDSFYPVVRIEFRTNEADAHYHVPLLLNPFGYSTYRGS